MRQKYYIVVTVYMDITLRNKNAHWSMTKRSNSLLINADALWIVMNALATVYSIMYTMITVLFYYMCSFLHYHNVIQLHDFFEHFSKSDKDDSYNLLLSRHTSNDDEASELLIANGFANVTICITLLIAKVAKDWFQSGSVLREIFRPFKSLL